MKLRSIAFLASLALAMPHAVFAQAAPAAPGTTSPTPATGAAPAGKSSAEKPKPLGAGEKKFLKDATEGIYLVLETVGGAKQSATAEATKTLADKLKTELDKVWEDIAGFATANGETLPSELKGGSKSAVERLKKAEKEKWDKQFLNIAGKEVKKLVRAFDGAKTLQNQELKTLVEKHRPTITRHEVEITSVEKDLAKR